MASRLSKAQDAFFEVLADMNPDHRDNIVNAFETALGELPSRTRGHGNELLAAMSELVDAMADAEN